MSAGITAFTITEAHVCIRRINAFCNRINAVSLGQQSSSSTPFASGSKCRKMKTHKNKMAEAKNKLFFEQILRKFEAEMLGCVREAKTNNKQHQIDIERVVWKILKSIYSQIELGVSQLQEISGELISENNGMYVQKKLLI